MRYILSRLQGVATVAIVALGISSHASAVPIYTVDPARAFGAVGGPHPGPFQADFVFGNLSTLVTLDPVGLTLRGAGWINLVSFANNNNEVFASTSGLNSNWQMWAELTYNSQLISGPYAQPSSLYNLTNLTATFWVDPSIATPTRFTAASNAGGAATADHGTDAFQIGSAALVEGLLSINSSGGASLNSTQDFHPLNAAGTSLFTDPAPFYNGQFVEFNNTREGVFVDPAGRFIAINNASGGIDFNNINNVPEPGSLALVGISLLGFAASRRCKSNRNNT
jgi:hypothetical protein